MEAKKESWKRRKPSTSLWAELNSFQGAGIAAAATADAR